MSYGLDNYVNNKVSAPVLLFLTILKLDVKKKENWVPIVFISALDKISMDIENQSADF